MEKKMIEELIMEVLSSMNESKLKSGKQINQNNCIDRKVTYRDYPLSKNMADTVKSATGKKLDDFTIDNVMSGKVGAADCRIAPATLEMQAEIAESINRDSFARNLRRASELISIPDERILEIYNSLRPYRSTKQELFDIAEELEKKYNAHINAEFIKEAAILYEKRDRLRKD